MSATEFMGMFIGALAALLGVAVPIVTALLKLNTTLVKLSSVLEAVQKDSARHDKAFEINDARWEAHEKRLADLDTALNGVNIRCRYVHEFEEDSN